MDRTKPTAAQLRAVTAWAALYGRHWKAELNHAWYRADYAGFEDGYLLQQVRNTLGPRWLATFTLAADTAEPTEAGRRRMVRAQYARKNGGR